jgi:hypothetical protein
MLPTTRFGDENEMIAVNSIRTTVCVLSDHPRKKCSPWRVLSWGAWGEFVTAELREPERNSDV